MQAPFLLLGAHTNPDGDAIGSCFGLGNLLQNIGKKVYVCLEAVPAKYHFVPTCPLWKSGLEDLQNGFFLALDCGDPQRLGEAMPIFSKMENGNLDHHVSNTFFAKWNHVDGSASSTSELVCRLAKAMGLPMTRDGAIGLYTGIVTDTGGFQYSSTSADTMREAGALFQQDVPTSQIFRELFHTKSFAHAKAMGRALEKATRVLEGRIVFTFLSQEDQQQCGTDSSDLDGIVETMREIEGTEVALFFYETKKDNIKVSFRSQNINVSDIALQFAGGGHEKAAGCTIEAEEMEKVLQEAINAVKHFQQQKG